MASENFGIYILTYPGDFHLSTILVRSIQHVSPDLPVMIIPGEGFDLADHPFDVPARSIVAFKYCTGFNLLPRTVGLRARRPRA